MEPGQQGWGWGGSQKRGPAAAPAHGATTSVLQSLREKKITSQGRLQAAHEVNYL